ncbi:gliding motility protein [Fibrella sp. HMF5335]|uniref:Gliding motility protein n=1 Tax=Fibrella rubiginis TaxID=2817060 RepID=A0A939GH68_9BACT|nr:gliding motility protein [Fibrella rubiginis]MBO0937400.1 gliding motility protein [Fibrella rubiginis]
MGVKERLGQLTNGLVIGLSLVVCVLFTSCTKTEPVSIERLEEPLFAAQSPAQVRQFLTSHPGVANLYFNANDPASDTALVAELTRRVNNPELRLLYGQTKAQFGDASTLQTGLTEAFDNIQKDFLGFKRPRVATIATGFLGPDLLVTDSLIVIAVDYFAGPKAKYRPIGPEFPQYVLRRYQQNYIIPTIVRMISDRFNATDPADQTLLADMVHSGKGLLFTRTILPETPDSLIIGYSDRQLTQTFNSQDQVWAHFIDNQLLYNTSGDIKQRYMEERPFVAEIGTACPGRIGQWLGWRIVSYYQTRQKASLPDIMQVKNAQIMFQQSGYKGQKEE